MSAQTSARDSVHAALHHAVKRIPGARNQRSLLPRNAPVNIQLRRRRRVIRRRRPIRNQMIPLPERPVQADSHSQIQCQIFCDVVVILKVRLENLEVDVILRLRTGLRIARNISRQHVGKRISRRHRRRAVKIQISAQVRVGHFILLGVHEVAAKHELVLAQAYRHVIAKRKRRIRILPGERRRSFAEPAAVSAGCREANIRQLPAKIRE